MKQLALLLLLAFASCDHGEDYVVWWCHCDEGSRAVCATDADEAADTIMDCTQPLHCATDPEPVSCDPEQ